MIEGNVEEFINIIKEKKEEAVKSIRSHYKERLKRLEEKEKEKLERMKKILRNHYKAVVQQSLEYWEREFRAKVFYVEYEAKIEAFEEFWKEFEQEVKKKPKEYMEWGKQLANKLIGEVLEIKAGPPFGNNGEDGELIFCNNKRYLDFSLPTVKEFLKKEILREMGESNGEG
jgi:exonuclease VII large subunit